MKPKFDKVSFFSMLFILFLISIPGFVAYYFTDWRTDQFFNDMAQRTTYPEFQEASKEYGGRIVLRKDKCLTINKARLVFKGFKDNKIHLDVYLLDLDPESVYPHYISKANAFKGIRLGDSTYQLLKVSKKSLQLKIIDLYRT